MDVSTRYRVLIATITALLIGIAWTGILDELARDYATRGLLQSGAFYGILRLLNALVSMFQEVQINFLVSNLAIGQLLDPLNDVVEYVADGLRIAIGSYLLQRLIVEVASTVLFNVIYLVSGTAWTLSLLLVRQNVAQICYKLFVTLTFVRFSVVIAMLATTAFSQSLIDQKIEDGQSRTESLSASLKSARQVSEDLELQEVERLQSEIATLRRQKEDQFDDIQERQGQVVEAEKSISRLEAEKSRIRGELGIVDSLRGNEETRNLDARIADHESQLSALLDNYEQSSETLEKIDERIRELEEQLYTDNASFTKVVASGVDSTWDYISGMAGDLVDSTMQMLILFVFKMILLPAIFLYLLLRVFKMLWRLDVRDAIKAGEQKVVDEITKRNA